MSKEAVLKVKEAEDRAAQIVFEAHENAKKMVSDAEAEARSSCEKFESELRADYKSDIDEIKRGVDEIIEKNKADDEKRYQVGRAHAEFHMNDAVKLIIQGVMSECQ